MPAGGRHGKRLAGLNAYRHGLDNVITANGARYAARRIAVWGECDYFNRRRNVIATSSQACHN